MNIIIPAAKLAAQILGKQNRREDVTYRLFKYVVKEPVEDGLLLYNSMTLELLLLSTEEAGRLIESDELVAKWFLVPEEYDDRKLSAQLKVIAASLQKPKENITEYTIFTTTHCNARCYYCYEQGYSKKHMSLDTAREVVRFIVNHCGENEVQLHWFGGDPFVNSSVIDVICRGLVDMGIHYSSNIVTNGYLFDRATIRKAVDLWRLSFAQITLDGTEEVYNRTKAYVNLHGSPFRRVLDNMPCWRTG